MNELSGVLAINKQQGFTSFDVVAKIRKIVGVRRVGHAGTLDPMATGVLPILVCKATKLCDLIPDKQKEYIARFKLGITTDTLDITGKELTKCEANVRLSAIKKTLQGRVGESWQLVPMFSAVKVGGERLYKLARKGLDVSRPKKLVNVEKLELICYDDETKEGRIFVACSKGTYIRSLISEIGDELGCGATLTELCRIKSCGITIDQALSLEEVEQYSKTEILHTKLIGMDSFFSDFSMIKLSEEQAFNFANGAKFSVLGHKFGNGEIIRVYNKGKESFMGLGIVDEVDEQTQKLGVYKLLI